MSQNNQSSSTFRYREANEDERKILEGIKDPELRKEFMQTLREKDWVIFTPRNLDFEHFEEFLQRDPVLRDWIEREVDPVLIAERLSRAYPEIFYTIEYVYEIYTNWKISRMKKVGFLGGNTEPPKPIPGHLLSSLDDGELAMVARRQLRKEIKALNKDPRAAIKHMRETVRAEKHPQQKRMLEHVLKLMRELVAEEYPAFVDELKGSPFPSMHVRLWVRQILERGNALVVGDVGTQKTSAACVGLEKLGCKNIVVICRSYARDMWRDELPKYHKVCPETIVFEGIKDFEVLETLPVKPTSRRFIIVGYGSMQQGHSDEDEALYSDRLVEALARLRPDAVVIDEAHAIKGNGGRSQRVLQLSRLKSVKHRLMLTATPFENNPNEVAHIATLLDPEHFPDENVFLGMCRDNPRIFFGLMSQRMCDYFAQNDVLDLPSTNLDIHNFFPSVRLPCPKDMARVHRALQENGELEARQMVVRMTRFLSVPFAARDWHPELRNLRCFTDPLANPKLEYLRKQVAERIKKGKVVVASGIYASGITRALDEGEDEHAIAALFERWFPGKVLRIDGATEDRDSVVDRWRNDPGARILIASVPAAAESLNFTLGYVRGSVEKITVFYLSLPWKPTQYLQFNGRFRRPGGEVPVETMILVVDGTADEALLELNERKWKNFLTGVHGMPILAEEEKAIEESTFQRLTVTPSAWLRDAFAKMLGLGETGIQKLHAANLHGLPIERTIAEYYLACEEQGTAGQVARVTAPMLQRWKESGVIPEWEDVLDVGCGPLVLERRVNAPLHAIDINPMMITIGAARSYHGGRNAISGCASRMPDEWADRFGFVIASLMLDLTSARKGKGGIERVKVLQEFHRVLKPSGHLWCVFQERCFEPSSLTRFTQALESYGFERVDPWCNQIEALDQRPHTFRFWSVLLRKKSDLRLVDPPCPLFEQELEREGVEVKGKGLRKKPAPPSAPGEIVQHELFAIRDQFAGKVSLEEAALLLIPLRSPYEDLHRVMVDRFRIRSVAVVERLRVELDRQRPRSLSDMKHIWRTIRGLPEAPRVKWEQMAKVTKRFFKAS